MGNITAVPRKNGELSYRAQIRIKRRGLDPVSEIKTFPKKSLALTWMKRREAEIEKALLDGELQTRVIRVGEMLAFYQNQSQGITEWGRSKTKDMERLSKTSLMELDARKLSPKDVMAYAQSRRLEGAGPATVMGDLIWLRQVFLCAVVAFNMKGPLTALEAAKQELLRQKIIDKPMRRNRRMTVEEEQKILDYYARPDSRQKIPMHDIVRFALLTARRREEITRLRWDEIDFEKGVAWLDDVKHPRRKKGNRRCFRILSAALEIIQNQPRTHAEVFPYNPRSISDSFKRVCDHLEIKDLHFHDLRHEATSRLFEKGYSIQEVEQFTLHESWQTLKRYTHLKPESVPEK